VRPSVGCAASSTRSATRRESRCRSGDGLHIQRYGALPHGRRVTVGGGSVELYGTGRYFAVTGDTWGGTPHRLGDLQHVIDLLLAT